MNYELITILASIAIAWWSIHKDMVRFEAEMRERMSRLEGLFEGFAGRSSR